MKNIQYLGLSRCSGQHSTSVPRCSRRYI